MDNQDQDYAVHEYMLPDPKYLERRNLALKTIEGEWIKDPDRGSFDVQDSAPLAVDLVTWTIWLRENTDFFSGPDLDLHYPKGDTPEFLGVLAQNALIYTGE